MFNDDTNSIKSQPHKMSQKQQLQKQYQETEQERDNVTRQIEETAQR